MYFTKYPHPANFDFATSYSAKKEIVEVGGQSMVASIASFPGDVHRIVVSSPDRWDRNLCLHPLTPPDGGDSLTTLHVGDDFEIRLAVGDEVVLATAPGRPFGVMGRASIWCFQIPDDSNFYGLGQKWFGVLDVSGVRTKFWNTDVAGDFHWHQWKTSPTDPLYVAIPYVVMRNGENWVGMLLENPFATFIDCGARHWFPTGDEELTARRLLIGSEDGLPALWILYGSNLPELTRKFQKLVGVTPLPPQWALGYHQSRWGYGGERDLAKLDAKFSQHEIPCDGLWLDIDYMEGYRVFTVCDKQFPNGAKAICDRLAANGRRVVPILDPGVKLEPGNPVYDHGVREDVFCRNPQGRHFVGLVWPGRTVFPDFSLPEGREWWAGYCQRFMDHGFAGAWVDMNDPSTGSVDPQDMLFDRGRLPHGAYHNQYALGMQMATREGFRRAKPDERPFVLSRSGFIGSAAYSAIWTGDCFSNREHLAFSIPCVLNMALSGVPFAGPDLGGFLDDCPQDLMLDWVAACFLFPFCRNHTNLTARDQEPWRYSKRAVELLRDLIRLRYRLIPYLYQLFVDQEERGEPMIRPLFYDCDRAGTEKIWDQFMVGPALMQAPFVWKTANRDALLPGPRDWWDLRSGTWAAPGQTKLRRAHGLTPIWARDGSIVPLRPGTPVHPAHDLREVEFHVFARAAAGELRYVADDGLTYAYQRGERSEARLSANPKADGLDLRYEQTGCGYGTIRGSIVVYGDHRPISLNGQAVEPIDETRRWTRADIPVRVLALP